MTIPLATVGLGLGLLRQSESSIRQILTLQKSDRLPTVIAQAANSGDMVAAGRLLSLAFLEDDVPVMAYPWTTQPTDWVESLVEIIDGSLQLFGTPDERKIDRLNMQTQRLPHLAGLMARVFARMVHERTVELDALVSHLGFYRTHSQPNEFTTLIKAMVGSSTFWRAFEAWQGDEAWQVLRTMQDEQIVPSDSAQGAILERLRTILSPQWIELIYEGGLPYDALIGQAVPDVALPELVSALGTLITQLHQRPDALGRWSAAARRLPETDRIELFGRLGVTLTEPEYLGIAGIALIHMPEIAHSAAFQNQPDIALRHVIPGLITSGAGHEDIVNAARMLIPIVQRAAMETRLKLRDELQSSASVSHLHNAATTVEVLWSELFSEADSAPSTRPIG